MKPFRASTLAHSLGLTFAFAFAFTFASAAGAAWCQSPATHPPIVIPFTLKQPGFVTLVIEDGQGKRIRNLVSETPYPAGASVAYWDGLDDVGRLQTTSNNNFVVTGSLVSPGTYHVRGLVRPPIDLRYQFTVYNPGKPPWATSDPSGEWLANHTPPSGVLFVPAEDARLGPAPSPTGGEVLVCSAVTEGGSGLAWLDEDGRKLRGQIWVGGVWTGATHLARDSGASRVAGVYAYAGSVWEGGGYDGEKPELRLAELLTRDKATSAPRDGRMGRGEDRPLLTPNAPYSGLLPSGQTKLQTEGADYRYTFPDNAHVGLSGLAVRDGFLVASLPKMNQLLWVDARARRILGTVSLPDPRGVAFDAQGRLLVLSGTRLLRYALGADKRKRTTPFVVVARGLQDPRNLTLDAAGHIYVSDRGTSNQVKVFTAEGVFRRAIGRPGRPKLGVYDPLLMHQPDGITVDSRGRLWVAETDFVPKRISLWDPKTGRLIRAFYGPMEYGGGGALDPSDKRRFFYSGLELALDWKDGSNRPAARYYQPGQDAIKLNSRAPETFLPFGGREYLTECYNANPTGASDSAALWLLEKGVARPVAAMGDANSWPLVSGLFRGLGNYSVRWTGQIRPAASGTYTFSMLSDDGARLWVNGHPLVNNWTAHGPTEDTGTITLQGGRRYDIRLEYYQGSGGATARLSWTVPGRPKQIIPAGQLYPTAQAMRPGGLTGRYYSGTDLKDLAATQIDPSVDFNWDAAPPAALTKSGAAFRSRLPAGYKAGDRITFSWSDANGDGHVQPAEVTLIKGQASGITVMPDLSFVAAYLDGKAIRFKPIIAAQGVPRYDLTAGQILAEGTRTPQTSGGGQALVGANGWTVLTVPPAPYAAQASMAGVRDGIPLWTYPSLWPGLHPSHDAPLPDHPGELIGTTRLLGGLVRPKSSDAGELWAINGNKGNVYLFTTDGLFVATLFQDSRLHGWDAPQAIRDMRVNDLSLQEENFWPSLTQTADGDIYLVGGGDGGNILRVDGLSGIQRLPDAPLTVTADQLQQAQGYFVQAERARQQAEGAKSTPLTVAVRPAPPTLDGKLTDWPDSAFVPIDSHASAALALSGDHLYAAFKTGDGSLLKNAGGDLPLLFKTGGALDIQLDAVSGGERLLVTRVGGKTTAALYRPHAPGTVTPPVAFSSPQRTLRFDRVDDVSAEVTLAGAGGDYELSVPLSLLGLMPVPGLTLHGDLGILRGNGFQTLQRVYWHNKATGLVSDIPSEAELTPPLWGTWVIK